MPLFNKRQRLLLLWGSVSLLSCLLIGYVAYITTNQQNPTAQNADGNVKGLTSVLTRDVTADMVSFRFEDVRVSAGIDFMHFPATRQSLLPEDMGSGLAWGDYDGDGDPDLFFVNFQGAIKAPLGNNAVTVGRCALYRNEGAGHFIDITETAGLAQPSFGLGAAWGDYDNDGDLDLYITNYGPNTLYRNNDDGTFTDVTEAAGVGGDRFSAGSVWGDYDNDGHIDLYV
ncbi:MAG: VCBS repeat-containing protein, partial [Gammaproteobacteria bacterium]|nr:VCBS repeat-containing protein [Gammaproteobacteria bacterium]